MSAFAQWLIGLCQSFLVWLYNHLIDLLQVCFDSFIDFIISVVSLFPAGSSLPSLPSTPVGQVFDVFLQCLNWAFPVQFLCYMVTFTVSGMLAYVVIMPLARWLKLLT